MIRKPNDIINVIGMHQKTAIPVSIDPCVKSKILIVSNNPDPKNPSSLPNDATQKKGLK